MDQRDRWRKEDAIRFVEANRLRLDDRGRSRGRIVATVVTFWCLLLLSTVAAQEAARDMVPVELDGEVLFSVRGIQALPAGERAASIASAIATVAADWSMSPDTLRIEERGVGTFIAAGRVVLIGMDDEDARIEGVQRSVLAKTYVDRIRRAIVEYREMRTRTSLAQGAARAAAAVAIAAALLVLSMWLLRRAEARLQRGFDRRVGALATEPNRVQRVRRLRDTLRSAIGLLRAAAVLVVTLFLVEYILVQFPWTRRAGLRLFDSIDTPLTNLVQGFVAAIPSLIVLAILFLITRYGLALAWIYFDAVHDRSVRWGSFDPTGQSRPTTWCAWRRSPLRS